LTEIRSLQEILVLPSLECRLPLSEIYLKVRFAPETGGTDLATDDAIADQGLTKLE
jgi:hypothetical protein